MHEFIKYLRKSFQNKRGKKPEDQCEKILGLNGKVIEFANFYEAHQEDILVFMSATLHKWEAEKEFSKDDLALYRLGLTELPVFMENCVTERDKKYNEEVKRRQLSVDQAAEGI